MNDFSSFISEQFGSGVSIRFRGQVEQLFTVAKGGRGSNIRGNECSASNEIVVSGEIIDSSYTSVDILSEKGEVYKCNLDHCTNIKSNENRHQPSVGDIIVAKGSQVSPRTLNGLEILCLHE